MMKLKSLMIAMAIMFSLQCFSQNDEETKLEWVYVTSSKTDHFYMKSTCISQKYSNDIQVWVKSKSSTAKKVKGRMYSNAYTLTLYSFECKEQKFEVEQQITYNSSGNIIESVPTYVFAGSRETVIPGSIGESLLEKACELFNKK